jgi:Trypsin-like peptidase domain
MRCPRCGTWLRADVSRCGPCGADLGTATTHAAPPPTAQPPTPQPPPAPHPTPQPQPTARPQPTHRTGVLDDVADTGPPWASGWTDDRPARRRHTGRVRRIRRLLVSVGAVGLVALGAVGATWLDEEPGRHPVAAHEQRHAAPSDSASASDFSDVYENVNSGVGQVLVDTCDDGDFTGTAFLIRPRLMVTANHVVEDAAGVEVDFEGSVVTAEIDGVDSDSDLAVLRLERRVGGHLFEIAGDDPVPGTRVAAIGYPLDEPKTLTEGTISGLDRTIDTESGTFSGLVQTDTAINPGNSGGPLVDLDGDVVGVADAIRKKAQGIGFAVPASTVTDLLTGPVDAQQLESCF